ncbi:MAG: hypothetical protein ABJA98_08100 [Acidobacteriota bacterium]
MRPVTSALSALVLVAWFASGARAADRYAVVITGASGGQGYAEKYDKWRSSFLLTLKRTFNYPDDHVFVLADTEGRTVGRATRDNVRRVFSGLRARLMNDDLLFVILIGHGTTDEDEAKFNLVGPDLSSAEWADLLKPIAGRLVVVNTTGGSFPFMRRLAGKGRIVVTATDSAAQQFETVMPEFFIKAFDDPAADEDKNGRVSIWEAFNYASRAVHQWFEQRGQLSTERPLLDDNGDGVGREAQNPGTDGALARTVYLAEEPPGAGDPDLLKRRAALERQLDDLRTRKASSPNRGQLDSEIERLLIDIAQLSRQLREKP